MSVAIIKEIDELLKNKEEIEQLAKKLILSAELIHNYNNKHQWDSIKDPSLQKIQKDLIIMFEKWYNQISTYIKRFMPDRVEDLKYSKNIIYNTISMNSRPETLDVQKIFQDFLSEINQQAGILDSIKEIIKIKDILPNDEFVNLHEVLIRIFNRFHLITRQLRSRRYDEGVPRPTLNVQDEYDMQDLFHSLLVLFSDDVRTEEWTPSYAGSAVRMDFLLKKDKIVIETKKSRESMTAKKLGEELIIDIAKYKNHPDCRFLYCFVYDPEGIIPNPSGIEKDLTRKDENLDVIIKITPK